MAKRSLTVILCVCASLVAAAVPRSPFDHHHRSLRPLLARSEDGTLKVRSRKRCPAAAAMSSSKAHTTTHHTTSSAPPPPKKTPPPAPKAAAKPPPSSGGGGGGGGSNTGGVATYFYQKGNAGACGTVHSDYDLICAMDSARYGSGGLCGKQVRITNQSNGKTVVVTVADECPTCINGNSIDLSLGAFEKIADLATGQVPISWEFQ